jgi:hypothetical protein
MEYPIAIFKQNDPLIYIYLSEESLSKTSQELFERKFWEDTKIIDSAGCQYLITNVIKKGLRGIFGWHPLLKGKSIKVEFTFSEVEPVNFYEFQNEVKQQVSKAMYFWENAWDIKELIRQIESSKSFNELINLLK